MIGVPPVDDRIDDGGNLLARPAVETRRRVTPLDDVGDDPREERGIRLVERDAPPLVDHAYGVATVSEGSFVPLPVRGHRPLGLGVLVLDGAGCRRSRSGVGVLERLLGIEQRAVHARERQVVAPRLLGEVHGRHRVVAHVLGEIEREHAEDHEHPDDEQERNAALTRTSAGHCVLPPLSSSSAESSSPASGRSSSPTSPELSPKVVAMRGIS